MAEPTAVRGRHLPALDGLRALAVAGVVAYHLRLGWAAGGYLGVDLFFVLSGFLITGLLLEEGDSRGRIALAAFWARRARRLLPALLVLLAVLSVAGAAGWLVAGVDLRALRGDELATLAYGANWHQIAVGHSYFAQFQAPSPLQHTWSLAIEEQFYVLWPPVLALVLWLSTRGAGGGPTRSWRRVLVPATVAGALVSAGAMAWLSAQGASADRLYYGTDTRAFDLLAGCALAAWVASRPEPSPATSRRLHRGGALAAVGLAGLWSTGAGATAGSVPPPFMFEGGFALAALAATVVVSDARLSEPGLLGRFLRLTPLRYLGRISYGVYLWHWPVITEMTAGRAGLHGAPLDLAQVGSTLAISAASYHWLELPLRRASFTRWPRAARAALAPVSLVATAVVALVSVPPVVAQAAAGPVGGAVGAVAGSGGTDGQRPVILAGGRAPSARSPLRVVLIGDSLMQTEAPAVEAALEATGAAVVSDWSFPGWGLSTVSGWPRTVPARLAQVRPDLVVAMWSWDDDWVLRDPTGYRATVSRFVRLLLHPGSGAPGVAGVLFEQYPPLVAFPDAPDGAAGQARRVAGAVAWSQLVSGLPSAFPGRVEYLPLAPAVERAGRFTAWLPPPGDPGASPAQWVRVRMTDDTHFCPAGAARYADALLRDLQTSVHLPAASSTWWSGSWSSSARFRAAAGACPADHPT